ncbi:MAG: type II toxin-antitoxin system Phd/YefM family antitoxin [Actinobacteria bacterium]|nr:type II toxin-antitoxin system Phd/YefM family antitoxin [Actinomycetota bacterium]MCL6105223.1 type II toxin-antitoxin system Phd/YefM family antitoxin [Actinomycetota bacterium]
MATIVNIFEAKTHLSQLLERVRAGEEIILAKNGKPYARLIPLATPSKRELGFVHGTVDEAFFEPLSETELNAWE